MPPRRLLTFLFWISNNCCWVGTGELRACSSHFEAPQFSTGRWQWWRIRIFFLSYCIEIDLLLPGFRCSRGWPATHYFKEHLGCPSQSKCHEATWPVLHVTPSQTKSSNLFTQAFSHKVVNKIQKECAENSEGWIDTKMLSPIIGYNYMTV